MAYDADHNTSVLVRKQAQVKSSELPFLTGEENSCGNLLTISELTGIYFQGT